MQKLLEAGVRDAGGTSQTFGSGQYLGPFSNQLDMGGKTGTSNNHSDAWFVGVTPSLVAGAWVGGEYRSIHFRTGALGQGSRTALPIVAQFFRSVMDDASLRSKYLHKYGMPPADIDASTYQATYNPPTARNDSLSNDSTSLSNEEGLGGDEHNEGESEQHSQEQHSDATSSSTHSKENVSSQHSDANSASSGSANTQKSKSKKAKKSQNVESLFD